MKINRKAKYNNSANKLIERTFSIRKRMWSEKIREPKLQIIIWIISDFNWHYSINWSKQLCNIKFVYLFLKNKNSNRWKAKSSFVLVCVRYLKGFNSRLMSFQINFFKWLCNNNSNRMHKRFLFDGHLFVI